MKKLAIIILVAMLVPFNTTLAKKKNKKNRQEAKTEVKQDVYINDLPAYVIYDKEGKKVTYTEMLNELVKHEICLFGELHDNAIAHFLEYAVTKDIHKVKGDKMVIGGEMWETDQQLIMDEFMIYDLIDKKSYLGSAKNWPNFRDYRPLVKFAKQNNLKFVCSNVPRRYANIIYKKGVQYLDSLPQQAYQYLPPMPIHFDLEQPNYKKMADLFGPDKEDDGKPKKGGNPMAAYKGSNLVKAQAIKDATMAWFILQNWEKGKYFLHYNGVYHSMNYQSIYYYLKYYNKDVDIVTISVAEQNNNLELDELNQSADFNIIVNKDVTKTYDAKLF